MSAAMNAATNAATTAPAPASAAVPVPPASTPPTADDTVHTVSRRELSATAAANGWTQPQVVRNVAHMVVVTAVVGALGWVALEVSWPLRVAAWIVAAYALLAIPAFAHEAVHGQLFHRRRANDMTATVVGIVGIVPVAAYGAYHMEHHVHTGRSKDPEGLPVHITSRWQLLLFPVGMVAWEAELWAASVRSSFGRPPSWVRSQAQCRSMQVSIVAHLVTYAALLAFVPLHVLAVVWLAPVAISLTFIVPYVLGTEHLNAPHLPEEGPVDQLAISRCVRSGPLTRLVYRNHNFHHAHHFLPAVSSRYLGDVSELITPAVPAEMTARSYTGFYRDIWRAG